MVASADQEEPTILHAFTRRNQNKSTKKLVSTHEHYHQEAQNAEVKRGPSLFLCLEGRKKGWRIIKKGIFWVFWRGIKVLVSKGSKDNLEGRRAGHDRHPILLEYLSFSRGWVEGDRVVIVQAPLNAADPGSMLLKKKGKELGKKVILVLERDLKGASAFLSKDILIKDPQGEKNHLKREGRKAPRKSNLSPERRSP